ncbi:hypothetical protein [Bradyrhizobium sp. Ai1a-2]|uniref:hypothetical protein n=1 Tax=Bradyrhizobium sp. Ai1a-2 TaxID=196490 RepID=UPI0013632E7E|nr:hypothetical protein [Bradyrhizobium sp. Ai1a-2]
MSVEALTYAVPGARLTVPSEAVRSLARWRPTPRRLCGPVGATDRLQTDWDIQP